MSVKSNPVVYDIRSRTNNIDTVRFSDGEIKNIDHLPDSLEDVSPITMLQKVNNGLFKGLVLRCDNAEGGMLLISSREDASNLFKALQYAIDNNWFGEEKGKR